MASYTKKNNKQFWQTFSQIFPWMRLHRTSLVLSEGVTKCRHLSYDRQRHEPCVSNTGRTENTHLHSRGMRVQPTRAGRASHSVGTTLLLACVGWSVQVCVQGRIWWHCLAGQPQGWRSDRQPTTDVITIHSGAVKYSLTCLQSVSLCVYSILV